MDSLSRRGFLQTTALALGATAMVSNLQGKESPEDQTAATPGGKCPWKKGIKTGILKKVSNDGSWEEKLTLAKECGFEGVEWDDSTTPEEGIKMQEMARKIGVPCHGIVFGGWHAPLSDPDPAVIKKGMDGMRTAIDCASATETKTCLLVPAVVKPEVPYDVAYKRSQDNVRKLVEHAEKQKVIICLENVWNKFLLSPMEFARYIDEIDSPWVKMYFDVSNSIITGYSEQWMNILGKDRIRKCDVKDFSRKEHKFVPVGEGDVDFKAVTRILKEWDYQDFLTSESSVRTKEQLTDSCKRLDQVFGQPA